MTISYVGAGLSLTPAHLVLATASMNAKSTNIVHVQLTNLDSLFMRRLEFYLSIGGMSRNYVVAEAIGIDYGTMLEFSGISLMPGESLYGYSETVGLITCTVSTGEQK